MKRLLFVVVSILFCSSVFAQDETYAVALDRPDAADRPKVGIVLSGGGAKGMAHVGVFRMLEELDIPVDYIVGTSIGSIMGAMYALGYSSAEIDTITQNIDWDNTMKDNFDRKRMLFEDKKAGDQLLLKIPFKNRGGFREVVSNKDGQERNLKQKKGTVNTILNNMPNAVIEGQNLNSLFTQISVGYQDDISFDNLPIPFACVAVDMNSKKEVVFRSGDIVTAIRASMSIPGYFAPIQKDGMFLVDGGMLNNFPVDVIREMGADIVIGVDLHKYTKGFTKPVENLGDMITSTLAIMNGPKFDAGRNDTDILISPNTSEYGVLSFDQVSIQALIDSGYVASQVMEKPLRELAAKQHLYGGHNRNRDGKMEKHAINIRRDSVRIDQITVEGLDRRESKILMKNSSEYLGQYTDGEEIDRVIEDLYLTRAFSKVTYSLVGDIEDSSYVFKVGLTPERLHQLGFGFRFDSKVMAEILLNASFNRHRIYGWKFDILGKLGMNPYASVTAGYAFSPSWQLTANGLFRHSDTQLYSPETDVRYSSYDIYYNRVEVYMQNRGHIYDLHLGVRGEFNRSTGFSAQTDEDAASEVFKERYFGVFASFDLDSRNRSYFATRGVDMHLSTNYDIFGNDNYYEKINGIFDFRFNIAGYIPIGSRVTFVPQLYSRYVYNVPEEGFGVNIVGGYEKGRFIDSQLPFVGTNNSYLMDDFVSIGRADVCVNIFGNHYVTAMANYLLSAPSAWDVFKYPGYFGAGLKYSIDTFVGPIGLTGHWSNLSNKFGVYFSLGYSF